MAAVATKNLTVRFLADTRKWKEAIRDYYSDLDKIQKAGIQPKFSGRTTPLSAHGIQPKFSGVDKFPSPSSGKSSSNIAGGFMDSNGMSILKGDMAGAITGVAGAFAVATTAAMAFYGAMNKVVDIGNETRNSIVQMKTLLGGSEERALGLFNELKKFGSTTPLELPEISKAANQLLAVKVAAHDVVPTLSRLGDIAKVSGKNFNELASIYAKNKSSNFIQGEDLNQLIEAGIPVLDEFSKMFGKSAIEVKKMGSENKIAFAHLEEAFKRMTSEGGLYFEGMKNMSKEIPGIWSNIQDTWNDIFRAISGADLASTQTTFWSYLKETLSGFAEKFSSFIEDIRPMLIEIGVALGAGFKAVWDWAVAIGNILKIVMAPAAAQLYYGFRAILWIFTKIAQFISWISRGVTAIIDAVFEAVGLFTTIIEGLRSAMMFLENLWVKMVTIFIAVGEFISSAIDMIINGEWMKLGDLIYKSIVEPFSQAWEAVKQTELFKFLGGKFEAAKNFTLGAHEKVKQYDAQAYDTVNKFTGGKLDKASSFVDKQMNKSIDEFFPSQKTEQVNNNSVTKSNTTSSSSSNTVNNNYNIKLTKPEEKSVFDMFRQSGRPGYAGAN